MIRTMGSITLKEGRYVSPPCIYCTVYEQATKNLQVLLQLANIYEQPQFIEVLLNIDHHNHLLYIVFYENVKLNKKTRGCIAINVLLPLPKRSIIINSTF